MNIHGRDPEESSEVGHITRGRADPHGICGADALVPGRNCSHVGSDSSTKRGRAPRFALFHTIGDMMIVILRMGAGQIRLAALALTVFTSLNDLISVDIWLATKSWAIRTVWHTGCPSYGCEGLRVLGTSQVTGWGLGITEIGRTGISSPHNNCRQGFQANPPQTIWEVYRQVRSAITKLNRSVSMPADLLN